MKKLIPKTNDPIIQCIEGVRGYVDADGLVQLNLKDIALGLDITKTDRKGEAEYKRINRQALQKWLYAFGILSSEKDAVPEYIPEPIFYLLSMKAENATARAFQRTIAYDVLPAIRKYGVYATAETAEQLMNDPDFMIQTFTALKNERERRQVLEAQVEKDRPKVLFADAVATAHTSILVGELAKLLKQNGVDTGQNRLFNWMRSNGYLIRREGTDYNMPTQRSMEMGLFEIKETSITHADGHVTVNKTPKVTGKGQQYFIEKFLEQEPKATVCK